MRDYVLDDTRHAKFYSDRFRGFCYPNMRPSRAFDVTSFFFVFWFFNKAKIRQGPKDFVKCSEVPFEGSNDYI